MSTHLYHQIDIGSWKMDYCCLLPFKRRVYDFTNNCVGYNHVIIIKLNNHLEDTKVQVPLRNLMLKNAY